MAAFAIANAFAYLFVLPSGPTQLDSFESLIATILRSQGYWVHSSFKVELSKQEKVEIGIPSSPRWELDLVAYKGGPNEIRVVECKSYLNSQGVLFSAFAEGAKFAERYKLFTKEKIRSTVLNRLGKQLEECGLCRPSPQITLCLAAGNIASDKDRAALQKHFAEKDWLLFDEDWIHEHLEKLGNSAYENDIGVIVAKLYAKRLRVP
jgi:hypothetical protein